MITREWMHIGEECIVELTDEEKGELVKGIATLLYRDLCYLDDDDVFTEVGVARKYVPERLARALIDFRRNGNEYGTLLIRNLMVDRDLPPTPQRERDILHKTCVSEYTLLLLMTHLGEAIAYADEKNGAVIQNIVPIAGEEEKQENTGSVFLEFHTEDGFHPYKPDYIGLFCLRSDHDDQAVTATASIRRAIDRLPHHHIDRLREPLYQIELCSSFLKNNSHASYSAVMPVLSGDSTDPELCIDFYAMHAINEQAHNALEALKSALLQVVVGHKLSPGDMLIIDNRVAAHARTGFRPRYDGNDRWLQRLFVIEHYRRSRPGRRSRGSHVCVPLS